MTSNVTTTDVTNAVKIIDEKGDLTSNATARKFKPPTSGINGSTGSHLAPLSASLPILKIPDPNTGGSSCQDGCAGMIL